LTCNILQSKREKRNSTLAIKQRHGKIKSGWQLWLTLIRARKMPDFSPGVNAFFAALNQQQLIESAGN